MGYKVALSLCLLLDLGFFCIDRVHHWRGKVSDREGRRGGVFGMVKKNSL
jgi:hypothetical protein